MNSEPANKEDNVTDIENKEAAAKKDIENVTDENEVSKCGNERRTGTQIEKDVDMRVEDSESSEDETVPTTVIPGDTQTSAKNVEEKHNKCKKQRDTDTTIQKEINRPKETQTDTMKKQAEVRTDTSSSHTDSNKEDKEATEAKVIEGTQEISSSSEDETEIDPVIEPTREPEVTDVRPRRSERTRKKPTWLSDYQSHQMTTRSVDARLQALNTLFGSGILEEMSTDIAQKVVNSIWK